VYFGSTLGGRGDLFREGGVEGRDEGLSEPEGEDELWSGHEKLSIVNIVVYLELIRGKYLWNKTLEEGGDTLVLHHAANNLESTLWVLEVSVLDTGLDDIERSRDDERGSSTTNGGDEVLEPSGLVVVRKTEEVTLSESGTTEELY
jgi:hypothetical protein